MPDCLQHEGEMTTSHQHGGGQVVCCGRSACAAVYEPRKEELSA